MNNSYDAVERVHAGRSLFKSKKGLSVKNDRKSREMKVSANGYKNVVSVNLLLWQVGSMHSFGFTLVINRAPHSSHL
jgi:hypothetical protein